MTYQQQIGNLGEKIAADFLLQKGYKLLDQNYHTRYGELDLVTAESEIIVFIEVKTRTSGSFGNPETSITEAKLQRIHNAALLWLQEHPEVDDDWRIDAVAITLDHQKKIKDIQHFINIQ
mgnify:CR=1 FL=1